MTTTGPTPSAADFAAKWRDNPRRERAASQEHFIDLCHLLGVPTPNDPPANEGDILGIGRTARSQRMRTSRDVRRLVSVGYAC